MAKFALLLLISILPSVTHAFTVISKETPDMRGWDAKVLKVNLNKANCPPELDMEQILWNAMAIWNAVLLDKFAFAVGEISGTSAESAIRGEAADSPVVVCDGNFVVNTQSDGGVTPGQTGVVVDTRVNHIVYGYVLLNAQIDVAAAFDKLSEERATVVVAHELGHLLGLGHSSDPSALMYHDVSNKRFAMLASDDIQGAIHLYTPRPGRDGSPLGCGHIKHDDDEGSAPLQDSRFWAMLLYSSVLLLVVPLMRVGVRH